MVPNFEYEKGVKTDKRLKILLDRNTFAKELKEWKKQLSFILNKTLEKNGLSETLRYDHRSYRESCLDLRRQCHQGNGLEAAARIELNSTIRKHNELVLDRMEILDKIAELRQREEAKILCVDATVTKIDPELRIEAEEVSIPEAVKQEGRIEEREAPPFTLRGSKNPAQGESKSKTSNDPNDPISTAPIILPIEVDDIRNIVSKKSTDKKKRKRTRRKTDYVERQVNRIEKLFEHLTAGIEKTNYNLILFPSCAIVDDSFKASSIRFHDLQNSIFETLERDIPVRERDEQFSMGDPFTEVPKLLTRIGLSLRQARKLSSTLAEDDTQSRSRIIGINTDTIALLASVKEAFQAGHELSKSAGLTAEIAPQSPTPADGNNLQDDSKPTSSAEKPSHIGTSGEIRKIEKKLNAAHMELKHSFSTLTLFRNFSSGQEDAMQAINIARKLTAEISLEHNREQTLEGSKKKSESDIEPVTESNDKHQFFVRLKTLDAVLCKLESDLCDQCSEERDRGFSEAISLLEELQADVPLLFEPEVLTPTKDCLSDVEPPEERGQDQSRNEPSFEL